MLRAFLDANVLFSAAYREHSGLIRLWNLRGVELVTSDYAAQEAAANLEEGAARRRLASLLETMRIIPHPAEPPALPPGVRLPAKDAPILQGAIRAGAAVLLTGDVTHFGRYFGKTVGGVRVLLPADFLRDAK